MEILRIFDLLENLKQFAPKEDIFARSSKGKWTKYSIDDYIENSYNIAYGLLTLGFQPGTKVITMCSNRPEWNFADMGITLAHMIHVPVYTTLGHDDFKHIFTHSDAQVIMIGSAALYKKVAPVIAEIDREFKVIIMDDSEEHYCFRNLYADGKAHKAVFEAQVADNVKNISPDDVCSIVYTSGTTGVPKGVMLSHRNLTFDAHGHAIRQTKNSSHKMVSFLPLCHCYERTMNYEYQELGISTYYAESLSTIASDLKSCKADGFCAVPRVLEMMYGKLEAAGKNLKGFKRFVYAKAWRYANRFDNYRTGKLYLAKQKLYDKLVYSKWRENLGGNEMLVVSGGSSIRADIVRTFNAAKLYIFEGYGMTEASPVIAVNSPADKYNVIGTVGKALTGTELTFAEDGEILTKGPHVMVGYYKNPEATAEIIDSEGRLHTGDIGYLVDGQYLKITDRKKEIFKLSNGKYIAPQVIETLLKDSPLIDNAIVVGENQKFASAIIIPAFAAVKEVLGKSKIAGKDKADMIETDAVKDLIHAEIVKVNKKLAAHENIKRERLACDEWSVDNNMLSQTLKPKRKNIHKKYDALIKDIYNTDAE